MSGTYLDYISLLSAPPLLKLGRRAAAGKLTPVAPAGLPISGAKASGHRLRMTAGEQAAAAAEADKYKEAAAADVPCRVKRG